MTKRLNLTRLNPNIGAIIHDVDLNHVDKETAGAVKQALQDHQVLFFRNQSLASPAQVQLPKTSALYTYTLFFRTRRYSRAGFA